MSLPLPTMISPSPSVDRSTLRFLARLPMFEGRAPRLVEGFARRLSTQRVRRGKALWAQGDASDQVMIVRSGVVALSRGLGEHEVTLDYLGRGEVLGLMGPARASDARMHEDGVLLVMPRSSFDAWLREHPELGPVMIDQASRQGHRLAERLALMSMHGARARLSLLLLDLASRFGVRDSRGTIVDVRLTHRELAALIGATRETVSVAVVELRQLGLIATEARRAILLDEEALRLVAA